MKPLRLDGWKAIGNFLGRDRTTAIRWARERGLPVHRVPGGRTGTIYALEPELQMWLASGVDLDVRSAHSYMQHGPLATRPRLPRLSLIVMATAAAAAIIALVAWWSGPSADAPVRITAIDSDGDGAATRHFTRALSADLARFANANAGIAISDVDGSGSKRADYRIHAAVEGMPTSLAVRVWLVSQVDGAILWSRRIDQDGTGPALFRDRVASNVISLLRCGFGLPGDERRQLKIPDLSLLLSVCQALLDSNFALAAVQAQKLASMRPDLAIGWAALALSQVGLAKDGSDPLRAQARLHARRAAAIAPDSLSSHLANLSAINGTSPTGLAATERALRAFPGEPVLLQRMSVSLFNAGYVRASVEPALLAIQSDPASVFGRDIAVRRLAAADRAMEARRLQLENEALWPGHPLVELQGARLAAETGTSDDLQQQLFKMATTAAAAGGAIKPRRSGKLRAKDLNSLDTAASDAYLVARLYESLGDRRLALIWLARAPTGGAALNQVSTLFWPDAAGLRTEPAFFYKMKELGLLDIWLARKEWPDFCAEPGLRYSCLSEAGRRKRSVLRTRMRGN